MNNQFSIFNFKQAQCLNSTISLKLFIIILISHIENLHLLTFSQHSSDIQSLCLLAKVAKITKK